MIYLWPISLTVIAFLFCLMVLLRETILNAEKEKERQAKMVQTWNPCATIHDFTVIELKPIDSANFSCKHTAALYRCKKCQAHQAALFPGEWSIEAFLKVEADEAQLARMMRR
jgi:hypothetical protein